MSTPTSTADFGTVIDAVTAKHMPARAAKRGRFADIKAHLNGTMPTVRVGGVYEDLDPRSQGRCVQVLSVNDDEVVVRTIIASNVTPRTPAKTRKSRVGQVSRIARRRFRPNSRGFEYLHGTPLRNVHALVLAARIAEGCDMAVTEQEVRLSDALIGLLGSKRRAHWYIDELIEAKCLTSLYRDQGGMREVLADACKFVDELELPEDWKATEVLTRSTATHLLAHVN